MTRWSPADLATALSRNPGLRVNRSPKPVKPILPSEGVKSLQGHPDAKEQGSSGQHRAKTDYKAMLVQQCEIAGLKLEPEFKFHPTRKFRADWLVAGSKVLIDYEGGIFHKGRMGHDSIKGIKRDIEKHNLAQIEGYVMIRVTPDRIVSGEAFAWIESAINKRTEK